MKHLTLRFCFNGALGTCKKGFDFKILSVQSLCSSEPWDAFG